MLDAGRLGPAVNILNDNVRRDGFVAAHQMPRRWYRVDARPATLSLYVPSRWAGALRDSTGYRRQLYRVRIGIGARWLPRIIEVIPVPRPATRADSLRLFGLDWQ